MNFIADLEQDAEEDIHNLLGPTINNFKHELETLYTSNKWRYYYISFAVLATVMVTWILIVGARVHQSIIFVLAEIFINISLLLDFAFKLYITGVKKYFTSKTNIFDSVVVISWVTTFLVMMGTSSIALLTVEEIIEDMLFVLWCGLQYLRIIMFFKHQKDAKSRAQVIF